MSLMIYFYIFIHIPMTSEFLYSQPESAIWLTFSILSMVFIIHIARLSIRSFIQVNAAVVWRSIVYNPAPRAMVDASSDADVFAP